MHDHDRARMSECREYASNLVHCPLNEAEPRDVVVLLHAERCSYCDPIPV